MAAEIQVYQNIILNYFIAIDGIYETEITFRSGVHPKISQFKSTNIFLKKIAGCCGSVAEHLYSMQENLASIPSLKHTHTHIHTQKICCR